MDPNSARPEAGREFLADLNPVQREAATVPGGPLLILAGAGSGKTRVLTHRIAWLIRNQGVAPDRILAVTFTNKAAGEMRARVAELLGLPVSGLWIGTFHAICLRWLRRHAAAAGYGPQLSVFDADDQLRLARRLLKEEGLEQTPRRARELLGIISRAKNRAETPDALRARARTPAAILAVRLYVSYQEALQRQNAADFDDLLFGALRLLRTHPEIAERYGEQFQHILVDEYQDTNHVQFLIVEQLARRHGNLFVVGDDDQSIYGWRGAEVRNILDFKEHFPEPAVYTLDQNYRSTRPILEVANAVIRHNQGRWPKTLWTERAGGARPELIIAGDEDEEAGAVADRIQRGGEAGRSPDDYAVFYRTHAQSRPLEDAFLRRGIAYRIVGGTHFYARREVKDLIAYLRLLVNPLDEESLRRAIGVPRRGVGERTLAGLLGAAREAGEDPVARAARAAERDAGGGAPGGAARGGLRAFGELVLALRARVAEPPERILSELVAQLDYLGYLQGQGEDWEERAANVQELIEGARLFSSEQPQAGVAAYLDQVSLLTSADLVRREHPAVTLMTAHNAKGLEFPAVFVTGLEEGLFPHASAREDEDELEEERRLFYVACTRAREELVLSASLLRRRYSSAAGGVSRFLEEIPRELVEEATLGAGEGERAFAPLSRGPVRGGARPARHPDSRRAAGGSPQAAEPVGIDALEHPAVGRRVYHATFGAGIVTAAEGSGPRAHLTVRFHDGRTRKVVQSYLEWDA